MRIVNGIERYAEDLPPVVATIGNFDGVHLGHQEILRRVVQDSGRRGLPSLLVSFDPHPLTVVAPERRPPLLQSRRQKIECLEQARLGALLLLEFDSRLAELTGEQFFDQALSPPVRFAAIHVGEGFRFGQGRQGDLALLRRIGAARGFEVHGVAPLCVGRETVSSSAIRAAVVAGEVERARDGLGRPYAVTGLVVRGDGRGRGLQCPTANLETDNELLPSIGVYVTETIALASRFASVTNVGVRPTFDGDKVLVETHLLDFDDDLYDERMEVRFLARLRDEKRFGSVAELADQLARDRAAAQAYFEHQGL